MCLQFNIVRGDLCNDRDPTAANTSIRVCHGPEICVAIFGPREPMAAQHGFQSAADGPSSLCFGIADNARTESTRGTAIAGTAD
jgi:hypothetical protein